MKNGAIRHVTIWDGTIRYGMVKCELTILITYQKTPLFVTAFNLKFFYVLRLKAGTISWYVPKSNGRFLSTICSTKCPKMVIFYYDFGKYQLIVPALNLKR